MGIHEQSRKRDRVGQHSWVVKTRQESNLQVLPNLREILTRQASDETFIASDTYLLLVQLNVLEKRFQARASLSFILRKPSLRQHVLFFRRKEENFPSHPPRRFNIE